jgi:hypothetical protein
MELALNLLWVLVSLVALRCWALRARESGEKRCDVLRGVVVLSCVLLLVFPSISITDDLHASSELAEDWTSFARKSKAWASQFDELSRVHHGAQIAMVCFVAVGSPVLARIGSVEVRDEIVPLYTTRVVRSGRAPPILFL